MNSSHLKKVKDYIERNLKKIHIAKIHKIKFNKNILHNVKFNKVKINPKISVLLIVAVLFTFVAINQYNKSVEHELATRAFVVYFGDKDIGVVRDKQEAIDLVNSFQAQLSEDYGLDIVVENKLDFVDTHAEDEDLTSDSELLSEIKSNYTFKVEAYALIVDGKELACIKSEEEATNILDSIKQPYVEMMEAEGSKIEEVKIVEDVKIEKKEVTLDQIDDYETVLLTLQKGTDEIKTHVVQEGENYWTIAQRYKLTVEDLERANPGKNSVLIHPGDELSLIVPKPYLTVATYEEATYNEKIDFDTEYEYSASLYEDQESIKKKGVYGEVEVVAKVEKHNGIEVAKEILKETLISQPIAQVVVKGTKETPPRKGTGSFIMPTRGTLTSRFGQRWGRMHYGIDLGARTGTAIKAADGGTVTFAGYNGSYGYMVEIDHGAGFTTRYGHCSKIYVSKGDKVYKDQTIAAVGSTGNSTGPHLHFEVRKYGEPQNPYDYIGKQYN